MALRVRRVSAVEGSFTAPPDKSLTHRALLLSAMAIGPSVIRNPLHALDTLATRCCLEQMGLEVSQEEHALFTKPAKEWVAPRGELNCGNSGTTMRLLAGCIASRPLQATLFGDASLSRRPMKRIGEPLRLMGAQVEGDYPPIKIVGADLRGIRYSSPTSSAQVKSCVVLAGLRAEGQTFVTEPHPSRDHTERMLRALGVDVMEIPHGVGVTGGTELPGFEFWVPGDLSSAAFALVAGLIAPGRGVTVTDVGVNPTRAGLLSVLERAGAAVREEFVKESLGEPIANVHVGPLRSLRGFTVEGHEVPSLLDEIPVLAVLATQCDGQTVIRGARELRVKESDRIETIASGLRAMGAQVETLADGLSIFGPTPLHGAVVQAHHDHRIAMSLAVAGLVADGETVIDGDETIATSYPRFERDLQHLYAS